MSTKARTQAKGAAGSWLLTAALVIAAGIIAWHASGAAAVDRPDPAMTTTLAAVSEPTQGGQSAAPMPAGALPTRLVVPSAGIDVPIREVGAFRTDAGALVWETAWDAAGHHMDSARPGQPGNVVISGHVSVADPSDTAVFATLDRVTEGDVIEVYAGESIFRYVVTDILVVPPDEVQVLGSDYRALITLVTCTADLNNRLVVRGELM